MPVPALPDFLYLNENSLHNYLSRIEGGISDESTVRRTSTGGKKGGVNLGASAAGANFSGEKGTSEEHEKVVRETSAQRFTRLIEHLESDPERWDYEDVLDLSESFPRLTIRQLISVSAEIEIPPTVQMLSQPEQLGQMFDMMGALRSMAPALGESADDLPSDEEIEATRTMTRAFQSDVVIIGDQGEDSPQIAGKLKKDFIHDALEDEVCVVGKIVKRWEEGQSHSLLALPGASLMNRRQRREAVSSDLESDDATLHGPALTLDILAIYR
ncbi:DUF6414 family protein [Streptomyces reniochalinae]|uniref:DUF6414 family protein n=1 Tax=Streptomyces reniochalinae TaxID=2250578 RepID=UPI0011C03502|nr:hypothetical protein [Streptomyces reniochalinae]